MDPIRSVTFAIIFVLSGLLTSCNAQCYIDYVRSLELSSPVGVKNRHVVLPHKPNATSTVPVNFTFTFPDAAHSDGRKLKKRPLILLLNGASVESYWYSRVIGDLASKGFVIAASDYYRPLDVRIPVLPRPGCRRDAYVDVSARLINTLYEFIHGASHVGAGPRPDLTFLDYADVDKLLLLSHSLGGYVAFSVLTGRCDKADINSPTCEGYQPVLNRHGNNVVIGTVAFEGYLAGGTGPQNMTLEEGTFALFLAGQYNKDTQIAYRGTRDSGACASYVSFHNMSHFGINDFVNVPESHQVTPCAVPNPHDDPDFTTDASTQQAGNDLMAGIINAAMCVYERGHEKDVAALEELANRARILTAHVHASCLRNVAASLDLADS